MIEHKFISDFVVVVNFFTVFEDIIFTNLRLIFLTILFPIHHMFYQDNHMTAKY